MGPGFRGDERNGNTIGPEIRRFRSQRAPQMQVSLCPGGRSPRENPMHRRTLLALASSLALMTRTIEGLLGRWDPVFELPGK